MMKRWMIGIILGLVILTFAGQAQARWWIFGKAEDKPEIATLFLAGQDVDQLVASGRKVFLDNSNLENGNIVIKGSATAGKDELAVVKISLDNGQKWEDINIEKGNFIYQFAPESGKEYQPLLKAMDTVGTESDLTPAFTFIYQNITVDQAVNEVLNNLVNAYESKSVDRFNSFISGSYEGDMPTLEEAIKSDFIKYDSINLDIITPIIFKSGKNVEANFDFYWRAVKKSDGTNVEPAKGNTSYTFTQEGGQYKLLAMKTPIIFGISRAAEITTGTTGGQTDNTSTVFNKEDVSASLTVYTSGVFPTNHGYIFSTRQYDCGTAYDFLFYEPPSGGVYFSGALNNCQFVLISSSSTLESNKTVPSTGYSSSYTTQPAVGNVFGFIDQYGKYGIMQITSYCAVSQQMEFRFKYQTDGSRNVP